MNYFQALCKVNTYGTVSVYYMGKVKHVVLCVLNCIYCLYSAYIYSACIYSAFTVDRFCPLVTEWHSLGECKIAYYFKSHLLKKIQWKFTVVRTESIGEMVWMREERKASPCPVLCWAVGRPLSCVQRPGQPVHSLEESLGQEWHKVSFHASQCAN